jgi:hypothetical protein
MQSIKTCKTNSNALLNLDGYSSCSYELWKRNW